MKQSFHRVLPIAAVVLAACLAPSVLRAENLLASDLDIFSENVQRTSDKLQYDSLGTYYEEGGRRVTGLFSLQPAYLLGDVNGDKIVDSNDAAMVLSISAESGSGGSVSSAALLYADADENGSINAADASTILSYSASAGVGTAAENLGCAWYFADADGYLQTGRIDDGNVSYYAGADYKLRTGWVNADGVQYLLDSNYTMLKNCWTTNTTGRCYLSADGSMAVNSWQDVDGSRYYFNANGNPVTGRQTIGQMLYSFDADGALQTGLLTFDGKTYFAREDGAFCSGLVFTNDTYYCFDTSGVMMTSVWANTVLGRQYFGVDGRAFTGWLELGGNIYYLNENGVMQTGLLTVDGQTYYLDADGIRQTGWLFQEGVRRYFDPATGRMLTGWADTVEGRSYFDADGRLLTGLVTIEGSTYYFDEDGIMQTGEIDLGSAVYQFDADGVLLGTYTPQEETEPEAVTEAAEFFAAVPEVPAEDTSAARTTAYAGSGKSEVIDLLNNTQLSPKRSITVYNRQVTPEKVDFTFKLSDADIAIIEQFAAEHFPEGSTLEEKLYITHQWIHYNVDYAYAGWRWNEIVNCSYVDAIFNHKMGQCVQYNGAMASVLAYYGYDVYMVRGYTSPGTQHFWTEVNIDGHTYMVECGNSGKNGDWWQEFFNLIS